MSAARLLLLCALICAGTVAAANEKNALEAFTKAIPVEFKGTCDPVRVILTYKDGKKIETSFEGITIEQLWKWEREAKDAKKSRPMTMRYTLKHGVVMTDNQTGKSFRLSGAIHSHPIDYAIDAYQEKNGSTLGMCISFSEGRKAWDAELNRIYRTLGGSKNVELRDTQRAWIKYRDAQIRFIQQQYGKRDGTMWKVVCASRIMSVTKDQVLLLQGIKDW